MDHNIEAFIKVANRLGVNIKEMEDDFGNPLVEAEDKIKIFQVYKEIISRHLHVKTELILSLDKQSEEQSGIRKLRTLDEINRLKREAIDLEVELIGKDNYIDNYQGIIQVGIKLLGEKYMQAQQEIPNMLLRAQEYVKSGGDVFSKLTNQIVGICSRFIGQEIRTQQEYVESHKKLKALLTVAEAETIREVQNPNQIDLSV